MSKGRTVKNPQYHYDPAGTTLEERVKTTDPNSSTLEHNVSQMNTTLHPHTEAWPLAMQSLLDPEIADLINSNNQNLGVIASASSHEPALVGSQAPDPSEDGRHPPITE